VRFVNSGTEATMSALRLARAFSGRTKVVKFEGGYHGHADGLLVQAGSGLATLSLPDSAGVPDSYAAETLVAPYNDVASVRALFEAHEGNIAAVLVEPVAGNMGVVPPLPGFLEGLRELTQEQGALLIFDEVITGFRLAYGGAQQLLGVTPDLTCLGKIIGGGLPVGAYGGRREIMEMVAPLGPVYQAGTLSGHPLSMAAGIATLAELDEASYAALGESAGALAAGLGEAAASAGRRVAIARVGSLLTVFFRATLPVDAGEALASDRAAYARFFGVMLDQGIVLPPSQFEAWFVSMAHGHAEIEATLGAARKAFAA